MTELEKIAYAKTFIDKLANGINPIDDSQIKEDDVVNNVRLSRCFFYVSDILRQVIERGGIARERGRKVRFNLSAEQLMRFGYSDKPIAISEIAKRLNELAGDENMGKVSHRDLSKWLISVGVLNEIIKPDGKTAKQPTEQGERMGVFTEKRVGQSGEYTVILYNKEAQQFIIDNLEGVIEMKYQR